MKKIVHQCKLFILKLEYYGLSFLNQIVPKKDNLIFMDDIDLVRFSEIELFKYLYRNGYSDYQIIYYTKKMKEAVKKYAEYKNVKFVDKDIVALYIKVRAKYCFTEMLGNRFACTPAKKQKIVQLWHGMALKKIGLTKKNEYLKNAFSYMLCYSDFAAEIMKKDWLFGDEKVLISQNPRDDAMFVKKDCFSEFGISKERKTILWLPTFRNNEASFFYDSTIDFPLLDEKAIIELDKKLVELDLNLVIKLHPLQREVPFLKSNYNNIYCLSTDDFRKSQCEFYEFIGQADALLSDYSSVAIDFMLLDRPIGYVIDDIEDYNDARGFHVDNPLELMPGHHITNLKELYMFLIDIKSNKDPFKYQRMEINKILNRYHDSNNCKRVLDAVGITME